MQVLKHFVAWSIGSAEPETQTSALERDVLARYAAGRSRGVEIGVWHGVTTCRLCAALSSDGVLFAIDPFPKGRLGISFQRVIAHREVAQTRGCRVEWIRSAGHVAAKAILSGGDVDFVFIDGDHTRDALERDWGAWAAGVERGGLIALHDSVATVDRPIHDAGSVTYTRDFIAMDQRYKLISTVETLTIWERL